MQNINRVLQLKRQQLRELQSEIDALERAKDILGEETTGQKVLKGTKRRISRRASKRKRAKQTKRLLSIPDAAEKVLKENGKPLHAREIAERIKKSSEPKQPPYRRDILTEVCV